MPRPVTDQNRLSLKHPALAAQWHPTKNGTSTPDATASGSHMLAVWICSTGHEWQAQVKHRARLVSTACPTCTLQSTSLAAKHPHVAATWNYTKNGSDTPESVAGACNRTFWWTCGVCAHEWQAALNTRTCGGNGCPACSHRIVTDDRRLVLTHPAIAAEWDISRNTRDVSTVSCRSGMSAWWLCAACGHSFSTKPANRAMRGDRCIVCAGRGASATNNLAVLAPEVAADWHQSNVLRPSDVVCGSNRVVEWHCIVCGHDWRAMIASRAVAGTGCPRCSAALVQSGTSKLEIMLAAEFSHVFTAAGGGTVEEVLGAPIYAATPDECARIDAQYGTRFMRRNGLRADITIHGVFSDAQALLIIEWDSAAWHQGDVRRANDVAKTEILEVEFGHRVVRLRETPLDVPEQIEASCVAVGNAYHGNARTIKAVVDATLAHVQARYGQVLTKRAARSILEYKASTQLQNLDAARVFMRQKAVSGVQTTLDAFVQPIGGGGAI